VTHPGREKPHGPPPSLWPAGFALGIAVLLTGLIVNWYAVAAGAALALVFGFLWLREAAGGYRAVPDVEPESRAEGAPTAPPLPAHLGEPAMPEPEPGELERFPRNKFLEYSTLGIGAAIGGIVTLPIVGFAVVPAFVDQEEDEVDLGPLENFPEGQFVIATFLARPDEGEVSRRTTYIRNNGLVNGAPSLTIVANRCVHLGCPVQPNGPVDEQPKAQFNNRQGALVTLIDTQPSGFGCPCHGGQYDTEGNRTAGPPVRALDRFEYAIKQGRLVLLKSYSVGAVEGEGADARIRKYGLSGPGEHVDGAEAWLYPIQASDVSS
jgi:menaquinol-cytochrome c reductase iron-sulfur subunit